tara:strand:- start:4018 stop:4233 length:216 start_codon:yes stop_codon:yes gene_type:complete
VLFPQLQDGLRPSTAPEKIGVPDYRTDYLPEFFVFAAREMRYEVFDKSAPMHWIENELDKFILAYLEANME